MKVNDGAQILVIELLIFCFAANNATAQETRDDKFSVGPGAVITVINKNGPISLGPSATGEVVVTTTSTAKALNLKREQHGNRISLWSTSNQPAASLVDYTVLVPKDAFVWLQSLSGLIHAHGVRGDLIMESDNGAIDVSEMADSHVHVKTLKGPIALSSIRHCRIDITSVSGDISLRSVVDSSVVANSGTGRITYEGDPGTTGDYRLTSHSGDLSATIPASAPVQIVERVRNAEPAVQSPNASTLAAGKKSLLKSGISSASRFVLRSFRGKIYLNRY
jgi:Putative adhesin